MTLDVMIWRLVRRMLYPVVVFVVVMAVGTFGYQVIGGPQTSTIDAAYMTYITIASIGFAEIVDMSHSPGGRVFTMFIAAAGILNFTYFMSALTAILVEMDINTALGRRRMEKTIDTLSGHYVVCGIGRVGTNVTRELVATARRFVVIDVDQRKLEEHQAEHPDGLFLHGDASDDTLLVRAGVLRAAGVFAITGDDSKNLVITLSSKHLNPAARVVARCHEVSYMDKIRRVGADDIISPDFTGGMRIASSMIRPNVVSFLDEMLRSDKSLRVEEIRIPDGFRQGPLARLALSGPEFLLLAVREGSEWRFNPPADHVLRPGDTLIVMTTPQGLRTIEQRFAS